jgi:hypothetical protein
LFTSFIILPVTTDRRRLPAFRGNHFSMTRRTTSINAGSHSARISLASFPWWISNATRMIGRISSRTMPFAAACAGDRARARARLQHGHEREKIFVAATDHTVSKID